jgi:UDP-glucose 4-epimerase
MNVAIITGAFGYIGTVLSKTLKAADYYVIGIDNNPNAINDWLVKTNRTKYFDEFIIDSFVSDRSLRMLDKNPTATVFHLAANSLLGPSAYIPLDYFENNTSNTLKLLQHIKPTNRLVFASTCAVYAVNNKKSLKETDNIHPPNNYGLSKLWSEQMIDAYYELGHIKATSLRFFNVVGADVDVGQQDKTPHIIPQLCEAAYHNKPFKLYSTDYPTPDGTCIRDYLHVLDVAKAMIHSDKYMESIDAESCHLKFNLGIKVGRSVKEIITAFEKVIGREIMIDVVEKRVGDPPSMIANPSLFIKQTKFTYRHSENLSEMIQSAWEYYNDQKRF